MKSGKTKSTIVHSSQVFNGKDLRILNNFLALQYFSSQSKSMKYFVVRVRSLQIGEDDIHKNIYNHGQKKVHFSMRR